MKFIKKFNESWIDSVKDFGREKFGIGQNEKILKDLYDKFKEILENEFDLIESITEEKNPNGSKTIQIEYYDNVEGKNLNDFKCLRVDILYNGKDHYFHWDDWGQFADGGPQKPEFKSNSSLANNLVKIMEDLIYLYPNKTNRRTRYGLSIEDQKRRGYKKIDGPLW